MGRYTLIDLKNSNVRVENDRKQGSDKLFVVSGSIEKNGNIILLIHVEISYVFYH